MLAARAAAGWDIYIKESAIPLMAAVNGAARISSLLFGGPLSPQRCATVKTAPNRTSTPMNKFWFKNGVFVTRLRTARNANGTPTLASSSKTGACRNGEYDFIPSILPRTLPSDACSGPFIEPSSGILFSTFLIRSSVRLIFSLSRSAGSFIILRSLSEYS